MENILTFEKEFNIKVVMKNGQKFFWISNINSDMLIADIKFIISIFAKIPINNQILIYKNIEIEDDKTLDFYEIFNTSIFEMIIF